MNIQLIRNATMKITYAGRTILTDPMLSEVGAFRSFAGIAPNPTVALPMTVEQILDGAEVTIISHLHPDHFDEAAALILPKDMPVFCQPGDTTHLQELGLTRVSAIETSCSWEGISISRTGGQHGSGQILERLGHVSGFVLKSAGEPTLYWVGDSIWCEQVATAIATHKPGVIIVHSGGATLPGFAPIIMDAEQTLTVLGAAPNAVVVSVHMESLDHCTVSRATLREVAGDAGIAPSRLVIPEDGETLTT
ncbi:MAG: MBL fold metallo-hydrolase [Proteobacteria bacterium]|nr:MBL fold metallo-hydrolase [Pseudomonadota bacterium]